MRISSSNIQFASQHYEAQTYTRKETITERIRQIDQDTSAPVAEPDRSNTPPERITIPNISNIGNRFEGLDTLLQQTTQSIKDQKSPLTSTLESVEGINPAEFEPSEEDKAKIELIIAAIERITGKKIKFIEPEKALQEAYEAPSVDNLPIIAQKNAEMEATAKEEEEAPAPIRIREVRYQFEETYHEAESTTFDAQGIVKTADGKEIAIDLSLSMSREFLKSRSVDVTVEEVLKDPLVINFNGTAAQLTDRKFEFDIDSDGTTDQISFATAGSGFLALDKNNDGTINNGNELFGANTGNGFAELAAYDDDGNGWIDEDDAIYEGLRIFTKDSEGNDQLVALGQRGVGAIYLGHTDTPFQIKDETNQTQGIVRSSGIFLNENGTAGTIQQLDLVI